MALIEIGTRILLPGLGPAFGAERAIFAEYDPLLGWAHKPGFRGTFAKAGFAVDVEINADRLRDREYSRERTGKHRMLVLGDSFGWGYGVELADRFDEVLEARHPDWEIVNASVSGYGTDQQLLYLKERGLDYDPDVVLLLFYRNDFTNNSSAAQYNINKPYFVLSGDGIEHRNAPVPDSSIVQRIVRFVGTTHAIGAAFETLKDMLPRPARSKAWSPDDHLLTRRLIEEMATVSRAHGARFVLVSIPMGQSRRAFMQMLSQDNDISYLALDGRFEAHGPGLVIPNDGHWNAAGHRVAADAIEAFLREIGVF